MPIHMPSKQTLATAVLVSATALLLAGCGAPTSTSSSGSSSGSSSSSSNAPAQPTKTTAGPSVQPFNVGGLLAGNAKPTFPAGEPGKVSVLAIGPLDKSSMGASL